MSQLSRIGDVGIGVCVCHDTPIPMVGIIVTGSFNVNVCNSMQSRVGDIVIGMCGHPGVIISSLSDTTVNGRGAAHIGSAFAGCFNGIISTGCSTTSGGR